MKTEVNRIPPSPLTITRTTLHRKGKHLLRYGWLLAAACAILCGALPAGPPMAPQGAGP